MTNPPNWFLNHPQGPSPLQRASGHGMHSNSEYHAAAMTPGTSSNNHMSHLASGDSGHEHHQHQHHHAPHDSGPSPTMMQQPHHQQHHNLHYQPQNMQQSSRMSSNYMDAAMQQQQQRASPHSQSMRQQHHSYRGLGDGSQHQHQQYLAQQHQHHSTGYSGSSSYAMQQHHQHQQHHPMYSSHQHQHHLGYQSTPQDSSTGMTMAAAGGSESRMGHVMGDFSTLAQQRAFQNQYHEMHYGDSMHYEMYPHEMYHYPSSSEMHHHEMHHHDVHPSSPSPPTIPPPPSPPTIPLPPREESQWESVSSSVANRGLSVLKMDDSNNRSNHRLSEDSPTGGPLRESRRQNSVSGSTSSTESKNNQQALPSQKEQQKVAPPSTAEISPAKNVSVSDASLLLGLRTNTTPDADSKSPTRASQEQDPMVLATKAEASVPPCPSVGEAVQGKNTLPTRLSLPSDRANLNSLHCFIRSELLEIFVIEPNKDGSKNAMEGRIGIQCVHCSMNRKNDPKREHEATMAVFYPRSISEIYRLVTNWTRCHLTKCKNIPPTVRSQWDSLRAVDKSRGKTQYWIEAAAELGLVNCTSSRAGGVRFRDTSSGAMSVEEEQHQEEEPPMEEPPHMEPAESGDSSTTPNLFSV